MDLYSDTGGGGTSTRLATPGAGGAATGHRTGLVVDVDYQTARTVLIGRVEGRGRFISGSATPSTAMPPIDDVSVGAKQSLRGVEEHTGLRIVGGDGVEVPSSGEHGVDVFTITGQPAAPVRLSLIALGESPMSAPMIAGARRTPTIVEVLTDRVRTNDGTFSGALFENAIREFRPDVLVILQGNMAESEWAAAIGTLTGLIAEEIVNLIIIVAGDQFQQQAAQAIGENADLRGIDPSEFAIGDIAAALEVELQSLYDARVDTQAIVAASEPARFVSRVRAGDLVTRFVARRSEGPVVAVDIGDGLVIHWATPEMSDVYVRPDIDVGRHVRAVFDGDLSALTQWLPFSISNEDLSHWVLNRALRPNSVAESTQDILIERAILVELLRAAWLAMKPAADSHVDLVVAGRPFGSMSQPALAVLTLLDALQPDPAGGVAELVLDPDGLVAAAGALGERSPSLAADVVEHDLAKPFATAIIVRGRGSEGDLAVRGQIRHEDGETTRFSVPYGSLYRVGMTRGEQAHLTLVCDGGFSIGGRTEVTEVTVGREGDIQPGQFGILIDARGRPIAGQADPAHRVSRMQGWLDNLGVKL